MSGKTLVSVARTLFWGGFALLPWLWLANYFLLRPYLTRRTTPPEVRWYATRSLWLSIAAAVLLVAWVVAFLAMRARSPALDWMTLVVPKS